jgi:hypothetical protein
VASSIAFAPSGGVRQDSAESRGALRVPSAPASAANAVVASAAPISALRIAFILVSLMSA